MIDKNVNTFEKGLVTDPIKVNQPAGSYSYALNAVKESPEVSPHAIQNEDGFKKLAYMDSYNILLGQIPLDDNTFIAFNVIRSGVLPTISLVTLDGTVTPLVQDAALNFLPTKQIEGTFKFNGQGERIIYFTDNHNPIRVFNIDKQLNNPSLTPVVADMDLFSQYTSPNLDVTLNDSGGSFPTGAVQFFVKLIKNGEFESPFTALTGTFYVTDEDSEGVFSDSTGAIDGVLTHTVTDKSFTLDLTDLDSSFNLIQVGYVLIQNGIKSYKLLTDTYSFNSSTTSITINGAEEVSALTSNDVVVDRIIYNTAKTITQKDNRLLIGNLSSLEDSTNLQEYANNVGVFYVITEELIASISTDVVGKDTYKAFSSIPKQYDKSFMRGEVYSFAVSYVMDNGNETRPYHIPGRNSFGSETDLISTLTDDSAKAVKQPTDGTSIPKWRVYDTSNITSSFAMSYWESDINYPSTGNFPAGKIRHHKMPDASAEPIFRSVVDPSRKVTDIYRRTLGIQIGNVTIPAELVGKIVGYRIWVQDRRSYSDRSIIAKGMIYGSRIYKGESAIHPFPANNVNGIGHYNEFPAEGGVKMDSPATSKYQFFDSPDTVGYKPILGDVLTIENEYDGTLTYAFTGKGADDLLTLDDTEFKYRSTTAYSGFFTSIASVSNTYRARKIKASKYVNGNTEDANLPGFTGIKNVRNTRGTFTTFLQLNDSQVPAPSDNTVYWFETNWEENFRYTIDDKTKVTAAGNKTMKAYYGAIKIDRRKQYGNVTDALYKTNGKTIYPIGASSTHFLGDVFIDAYAQKTNNFIDRVNAKQVSNGHRRWKSFTGVQGSADTVIPFVTSSSINMFITESYINHRYRNEDIIAEDPYYKKQYFPKSAYRLSNTGEWLMNSSIADIYYNERPDFNIVYTDKVGVGISNFELINAGQPTTGLFPTRIAYSESDYQEALTDTYRIFKANNYRDLQKNKGQLWKLFNKGNALYGVTENSLWTVYTSDTGLQTTSGTITIGSGGFLLQEPKELFTIDSGYAGTTSQWAFAQSPYGELFIDQYRGKVYLFGESFEEISQLGMQQFFLNNGQLNFKHQLPAFPNYDNPANLNGIGYIAAYDNKLKRFIITKRDYNYLGDVHGLDPNNIDFSAEGFENRGFTLSYYPAIKQWVSYHSYLPTNLFTIKQDVITKDTTQGINNDQSLFKVSDGTKKGRYFNDTIRSFIIEVISNKSPLSTKVFDNIITNIDSKKPLGYEGEITHNINDLFFNTVLLYNDEQCSGYIDLVPGTNTKRKERDWNLTTFRDIVENYSTNMFTNDWTIADYNLQYPIDKALVAAKINTGKPWYEQQRFRDKYLAIRFTLNNLNNTNFLCNFVNSIYRLSYR